MIQTADSVELRLYDMQDREVLRLHEFARLRFAEELVGGPSMLQAVIPHEHYADLPDSGFCPARVFVRSEDTGQWECWWGGFVEEMNPRSPDRSTCELFGQGWRRVLSFVQDYGLDFQPDLAPLYDVLTSTAYPHPGGAAGQQGAAWSMLLLAQQSLDYTPAGPYTTTQAGYYSQLTAATDDNLNVTGSATSPPEEALTGDLERMADDLLAAAQEQNTPLLWWFEPSGGDFHMGVLPAATAAHLVEDTHLLEIDARRDTSEVVNSVQAVFGDYGYPDVLTAVLQPPGPCPNYAPNGNMADWQDVSASANAVCPDTGNTFLADYAWRCEGWAVGANVGSQEFAWYEVSQGHRMPTDGGGNLAYPRGYGTTSLRVAIRRLPAGTQPLICQVETAYIQRCGTVLNGWEAEENTGSLAWQQRQKYARDPAQGRTPSAPVNPPVAEQQRMTADGRVDLVRAGIAGATMTNVQMYLHGYALPAAVTVDYRWTLHRFPSGTTTPTWASTQAWQSIPSGEITAAQTYHWDILGGAGQFLHVRWECRFPASVTSAEVQVCGVKIEHGIGSATAPGDFQPDSTIQIWRNVTDADVGVTGAATSSIAAYGVRHQAVRLPLPREVTSVTALLETVGGYLQAHAVPNWQVKGWHPAQRRFCPQDGVIRLLGTSDYCGAGYVLEKTEYDLDETGCIIPTLHLGSVMRHRRPSDPVDAGAAYIPPTELPGSFAIPRYTRG